jgi:hypothetical protein
MRTDGHVRDGTTSRRVSRRTWGQLTLRYRRKAVRGLSSGLRRTDPGERLTWSTPLSHHEGRDVEILQFVIGDPTKRSTSEQVTRRFEHPPVDVSVTGGCRLQQDQSVNELRELQRHPDCHRHAVRPGDHADRRRDVTRHIRGGVTP